MTNVHDATSGPRLGGKLAVFLFIITLLAFVVESQLTLFVQTTLGFRKPFFLFYTVHSSFTIIFPLHLFYLMTTTGYSARALLKGLSLAVSNHLSPSGSSFSMKFPLRQFICLILALTAGITYPGLLWFAAVSLASISDVTAIWNTNAFFAYLITIKLFKLKWEPWRLVAVSLATLGVITVVYGGSTSSETTKQSSETTSVDTVVSSAAPSAPLVGNLLTLVASFGYGLYQVLYKKYAALPSDPEVASESLYEQIPASDDSNSDAIYESSNAIEAADAVYPPPFGLHPNLLTSAIGFCTFLVLWIPLPILHHVGVEPFSVPNSLSIIFSIAGIALSGVVFNAGFMILLGVWGPIITSVGNLLTIVLVLLSDVLFGRGAETLTLWSLVGSGVIVAAFSVLAYDMFNKR